MPTKTKNLPAHNGRHWHHLYQKRRRRALGINGKQMAWTQVISLVGSVIAGVLLETNKGTLALVAGAFVVLPGIFDLDGSLGATLSAKINHQLEELEAKWWPVLLRNVSFALLISLLSGILVGVVGAGLSVWFFDAIFWQVFWLALGAIGLSALIGFPIIGLLSVVFRSFKINPDDVVGPIESSIFDILSVITMVVVIGWLT